MFIKKKNLLKAACTSVALLGTAAFVTTLVVPDVAYAKNDKAKKGKKAKKEKKIKHMAPKPAKGRKSRLIDGVHPSELGALNAAHASPNALANASPNSRVGKIAIYKEAAIQSQETEQNLADAQDYLAMLTVPDRSSTDIGAEIDVVSAERTLNQMTLMDLQQQLIDAGGSDPLLEGKIEMLNQELALIDDALLDLGVEYDAAADYENATAEVDSLNQQLIDQQAEQRLLLEAAGNKPVTDEVEATVQQMLGL